MKFDMIRIMIENIDYKLDSFARLVVFTSISSRREMEQLVSFRMSNLEAKVNTSEIVA